MSDTFKKRGGEKQPANTMHNGRSGDAGLDQNAEPLTIRRKDTKIGIIKQVDYNFPSI